MYVSIERVAILYSTTFITFMDPHQEWMMKHTPPSLSQLRTLRGNVKSPGFLSLEEAVSFVA